jgi:hypothetical protein
VREKRRIKQQQQQRRLATLMEYWATISYYAVYLTAFTCWHVCVDGGGVLFFCGATAAERKIRSRKKKEGERSVKGISVWVPQRRALAI